jgi:biotin-dependent carboxylase-like uncharacterized protein
MGSKVRVLREGMMMSFQDRGRLGFYGSGVPRSGALDEQLLRMGNRILGNDEEEAGLEFFYRGPLLRVDEGEVCMVLAGGLGCEVRGRDGSVRKRVDSFESFCVRSGESVDVGEVREGTVGYILVEGGWKLESFLGSFSFYGRAKLGTVVGDILETRSVSDGRREGYCMVDFCMGLRKKVRVMWGPQADYFSEEAREIFATSCFEVESTRDRMGLRLKGAGLESEKGYDVRSEGLVPGVIQVPGSGHPIVLLNDCQTMGGYPKIGTVISADLRHVGQWGGGDKVSFEVVGEEEAYEAFRVLMEEEAGMKVLERSYDRLGLSDLGGTGFVDALSPFHFPGSLEEGEESE